MRARSATLPGVPVELRRDTLSDRTVPRRRRAFTRDPLRVGEQYRASTRRLHHSCRDHRNAPAGSAHCSLREGHDSRFGQHVSKLGCSHGDSLALRDAIVLGPGDRAPLPGRFVSRHGGVDFFNGHTDSFHGGTKFFAGGTDFLMATPTLSTAAPIFLTTTPMFFTTSPTFFHDRRDNSDAAYCPSQSRRPG